MAVKSLESIDLEILSLLKERDELANERLAKERPAENKCPLSHAEIGRLVPQRGEPSSLINYFVPPNRLFGLHLDPQLVPKVAYLGPPHTYSHRAAVEAFQGVSHAVPRHTMRDAFASVERDECDFAVLPLQNSTDGMIDSTLDLLLENHCERIVQLYVIGEYYLRVRHCLLSHAGNLSAVKTVVSRDTALRQCSKWLSKHCPQAELKNAESTTLGATIAAQDPTAAAVGDIELAQMFGLPPLDRDIGDEPHNMTQFVLIGKEKDMPTIASGNDKTMFALTDGSVKLEEVLRRMLDSHLEISSVHPRPLRTKPFARNLVIEVGCHYGGSAFRQFQSGLGRAAEDLHILGSWPAPRRPNEEAE